MTKEHVRIEPLSINGLNGRVLRLAGSGKEKIILIYGVHSSLERMSSTAEFLSDYGPVIMPDLPGIGGMSSFYSIGLTPSLDNYADYLYTFLKISKLDKQLTVVAMSFGFLVVTRMLQKYPQVQQWTDVVISFVGFGRDSDFKNLEAKRRWYIPISRIFSTKAGGWFIQNIIFNPVGLRLMFAVFRTFNPKYKHAMVNNPEASQRMELDLWQSNDARTRFAIYKQLFNFDLVKGSKLIDVSLHDLTTATDQYLDPRHVTVTLRKLYQPVTSSRANLALHAPSIIGNKAEVTAIFSDEVKGILSR